MRLRTTASRIGVVLAAVMAIVTSSAGVAAAAGESSSSSQPPAAPPTAVRAELTLDCVSLSAAAREYAVAHGYCAASTDGGVTTFNSVTGDCGSSWIYIFPWGYAGEADVYYGFSSSKGTVIYRYLAGYWDSSNGLDGSITTAPPARRDPETAGSPRVGP